MRNPHASVAELVALALKLREQAGTIRTVAHHQLARATTMDLVAESITRRLERERGERLEADSTLELTAGREGVGEHERT